MIIKPIKHDDIKRIRSGIDSFLFWSSLICSLTVLFLLGYNSNMQHGEALHRLLVISFYAFASVFLAKLLVITFAPTSLKISFYSELVIFSYLLLVIVGRNFFNGLLDPAWIYIGLFAIFIVELSKTALFFEHFYLNPTILFVISFLVLILLGTFLLLLPKSTVSNDLRFIDAFFMATSAVCVTGLAVVDISKDFTPFGQNVILLLVQMGGLGIMTFTGFFGFFFTGALSYRNQLMFTEFINESKISSVVRTLYTIIGITFFFEALGAVLIFFTVDASLFNSNGSRLYFSVFHSISAFCNAGFSTLSNGLYDESLRFNYPLQIVIASLFIIGGAGFALIHNIFRFILRWYFNFRNRLLYRQAITFKPWVLSFNSKLISWTTSILLVFGTLACLALEYNSTLAKHPTLGGKLVTAFFTGATPRTAGFNTVDLTDIAFPTLLIMMFLMWIGGSPGSTGGGIKTTTFAVAILNIFSLARGYNRIKVLRREVSQQSVRRAFAIISLSIFSLGTAIFLLAITDGDKGLVAIAFEAFSAYNTVGLSLGLTPQISDAGRVVLIATMFMGRVGTLTLVITLIKRIQNRGYQYPKEEIIF